MPNDSAHHEHHDVWSSRPHRWNRALVSAGCAGLALVAAPARARAEVCSPFTAELISLVSPGVAYHDCTNTDPRVHVVTVNRALPDVQFEILADAEGSEFTMEELDDLADDRGALVAINGFFWDGPEGFACAWPLSCVGTPKTTVFINGQRHTSLHPDYDSETLLGFANVSNEGIAVQAIPGDELAAAQNEPYRRWMYGGPGIMRNGILLPPADDISYRQSLVGYSPDEVVLLVSDGDYTVAELGSTLEAFGVTDAVLNDGGRSARMVLRGDLDLDLKHNPFPAGDRNIAYGLGLVRTGQTARCKSLNDADDVLFGVLCVTPSSEGYDASLTMVDDGSDRCGDFRFSLSPRQGDPVMDQGAFRACTSEPREFTYFFNTGVLGGCANVNLDQVSGDDFGETHFWVSPCGDPGGEGGGTDIPVPIVNQAPRVRIASPNPWQLFHVTTEVELDAPIRDTPDDSHICSIDWDDGTTDEFATPDGACTVTHLYEHAGMYTVRVQVQDSFGATSEDEVLIVVYDPLAGANNSDGSFPSPAGSLASDAQQAGELWFHLAARYYPADPTRPAGNAQTWLPGTPFRFDSGSAGVDWLVVTPDGKIAAKGSGQLQGRAGSYGFVFYGYDGCGEQSAPACQPGPDRFRVVVWDLAANPNPGHGTMYDSAPDASYDVDAAEPAALRSGIVTVHPE